MLCSYDFLYTVRINISRFFGCYAEGAGEAKYDAFLNVKNWVGSEVLEVVLVWFPVHRELY